MNFMKAIVFLLIVFMSLSIKAENFIGRDSNYIVNETVKIFLMKYSNNYQSDLMFFNFAKSSDTSKFKIKSIDFSYFINESNTLSRISGPYVDITKEKDGVIFSCFKDKHSDSIIQINVTSEQILIHDTKNRLVAQYTMVNGKCTTFKMVYYNFTIRDIINFAEKNYGINASSHSNIKTINGEKFEYCLDISRKEEHIFIIEVCKLFVTN